MRGSRLARQFVRYRSKSDVEALAAVFDEVGPGLLQVARHLSARGCEPEDLVQSTFLTAIERAETYDAKRPLVPWLMGILVNQARLARRKRIPLFDERLYDVSVEGTSEIDLDSRELAVAVVSALREVPERYRQVLIPHLGEGMKPHEIAALLGRPQGTVRAQLHRGLKLIRRLLPTGFAASTAIMVASRESLAGVREVVLAEARRATLSSGRPIPTPRGGGEGEVLRQTVAACVLLAAGVAAWLAFDGREPEVALASRGPEARGSAWIGAPSPTRERPAPERRERATEEAVVERAEHASFGSLDVLVLHAQDRTPAPGVAVTVVPWGDERWFEQVIEARTDAEGRASFGRLHAGRVGIHAGRGEQKRTDVEGGRRLEFEIVLPPGIDLHGIVVDRAGQPIAGADVELLADLAGKDLRSAARTESDGTFVLHGVERDAFLRARTPGKAPGDLYWLGGTEFAAPLDDAVALVLDDAAPAVTGRVLDAAGRPVVGARVSVSPSRTEPAAPRACENGLFALDPPPARTVTDASGRFTLDEVVSGALEIAVEAENHPPARATFRREASDETGIELRLARGARVIGVIETQNGHAIQPAAGALIRARAKGASAWIETRADASGRYELHTLPAGEIEIEARDRGFAPPSSALVVLDAGAELRWNRVVPSAKTISGVAIGQDGRPVKTWLVKATPVAPDTADMRLGTWLATRVSVRSSADLLQCWADMEGRFLVPCLADGPQRLELRPRWFWEGPVVAVVPEVEAGARDVELRAPWRSARIRASLVGADGEPVPGAYAIVLSIGGERVVAGSGPAGTGRFETSLLIPGEYELVVHAPGRGLERLGTFTVSQLEELDLGLRRLAPSGGISIEVPVSARSARAYLVDDEGQHYDLARTTSGTLRRAGLRVGSYRLVSEIDGVATEREVAVAAGAVVAIQ